MLAQLAGDFLDPFPGRASRAFEICIVCMLVVLISMAYGIPDPATSAYLVFFAAKEDCGAGIITNIALVLVVTIVVAMAFAFALLSLNSPEARILILAAWSFAVFFLATASKLAPLAGTIGLIIAYAIDLFGSTPLGEIATRGLLYAWLFVSMPMGVFLAYNMLFGRRPDILAGEELARRIRAVATLLNRPAGEVEREHVTDTCRDGNDELLKRVKMVGLFHFQPSLRVKQLQALAAMTYNLSVATLVAIDAKLDMPKSLGEEVAALADAIAPMSSNDDMRGVAPRGQTSENPVGPWSSIHDLVADIRSVALSGAVPELPPHPPKERSGFFLSDAFHNPDHARYALKGTLAVMTCYLTFTLLDWPGIHTCMLTCFIVGLTTVGESMQKLLLRISGCLVGAAFGLLAIVYVLPHMETIWALMILIGAVTFPAAWVAVGRPSVSYVGFQAAFALYLCILQGDQPKFDLTIIRDRTIGILFGNLMIYLIFTKVFPVSALSKVRDQLVPLLARSRELLRSISKGAEPFETGQLAAALQASVNDVERTAMALGYETLNSPAGRQQRDVIDLCVDSLRTLVETLSRIAIFASLDHADVPPGIQTMEEEIDLKLAHLADALATSSGELEPAEGGFDGQSLPPLWRDGFVTLENSVSHLASALSNYRKLLRLESETNG